MNTDKIVAVWGVGKCMKEHYPQIRKAEKISFFVDSDSDKWGKEFTDDNIMCISPEQLLDKNVSMVYIAIYDDKAWREISAYLRKHNINFAHIYEKSAETNWKEERIFLEDIGYLSRSNYKRGADEKLVKYVSYTLPTAICNFRCDYCYMKQKGGEKYFETPNWRRKMPHCPEYMAYTLRKERLGGCCFICIAATGETLLVDGIVELLYELLKDGHVIKIATNGVITEPLKRILEFPEELLKNLLICFSVHYIELQKCNKLEEFMNNIEMVRDSAASLYAVLVASDIYYPYVEEIKTKFMERLGSMPILDAMRDDSDLMNPKILTELPVDTYLHTWGEFHSEKFKFRVTDGLRRVSKCMAGKMYFFVNAFTGEIRYCSALSNQLDNLYNDLDKDIITEEVNECPAAWCFASADIFPFRIFKDEVSCLSYGEMYLQVDNQGRKYIKEELFDLLCRPIG